MARLTPPLDKNTFSPQPRAPPNQWAAHACGDIGPALIPRHFDKPRLKYHDLNDET